MVGGTGPTLRGGDVRTFLLTDVEGSTRLWEEHPEAMWDAISALDEMIARLAADHRGQLVKSRGEGDSCFLVFEDPTGAISCALDLQTALSAGTGALTLRVRIAIHTGTAEVRDGDYFGLTVNRCARIRGVAHGGQVLISEAAATSAGDGLPAETSLLDLGFHTLKDLSGTVQIFQLEHPSLPRHFPPLRSIDPSRHNLPAGLTTLIGRAREMAEVRRLLSDERLVTITGEGGAGKTRLALLVANGSLGSFVDGVTFVELGALSDESHIPAILARALGVTEEIGRTPLETILDRLRSADSLVVMDNCEHVIDGIAHVVHALLTSCPNVRVLATSRMPLDVLGESVWRIPPLAVPPEGAHEEPADRYDAVRLFVDRAGLARPGFTVADDEWGTITEICRRLDGLPLAIELAAARVRDMDVAKLAHGLGARFDLLTRSSRTAVARQQTLRAALDWSYDLLSDDERVTLGRLSVFAGRITREAAVEVAGTPPLDPDRTWEAVLGLARQSLIQHAEGDGSSRLLETVRAYGRECLEASGERTEVEVRLTRHLLTLATSLTGGANERSFDADILEDEMDNLRAAMSRALLEDVALEEGVRLIHALAPFWRVHSHFTEGRDWSRRALARTEDGLLRYGLTQAVGVLGYLQGDFQEARAAFESGLDIIRELPDRAEDVPLVLINLGGVSAVLGDHAAARRYLEEAIERAQTVGKDVMVAAASMSLGVLSFERGEYAHAHRALERAVDINRELGNRGALATALFNIGGVTKAMGSLPSASIALQECIKIREDLGDRAGFAHARTALADVLRLELDLEGAHELASADLAELKELGDRPGTAEALHCLGVVQNDMGRQEDALLSLREALAIRRDLNEVRSITNNLDAIAVALAATHPETCVRILAAVEVYRDRQSLPAEPADRIQNEAALRRASDGLGDAYARIRSEGLAMQIDAAIALALGSDEPADASVP